MATPDPRQRLRGRRVECEALDRLLAGARAHRSGALVVRGEAGIGKSALLEYAVARAEGCRIARVSGVESEMELAFAGLHQLCGPMLDRLDLLPAPQRAALETAFGLSDGEAPDRLRVGLAVLNLLSEVAERETLVCIIDDAHWLDRASAQALTFAARRLEAEAIAIIFAVREPPRELAGLPELVLRGLRESDARALLDSVIRGPLDEQVRQRVVAEAQGNPLALLELPLGFTPAELAGGFGLASTVPLSGRLEEGFLRRLAPLPEASRLLLLIAAAEPLGEPLLLWRAAARLGVGAWAAAPVEAAGLIELGARVTFRHPLVRSAVYRTASAENRQAAHRALASVTDPENDPDRRAWHAAHAATGPDEEVAGQLERSAGRAQERGGLSAAAAFLDRAAALTPDPVRRPLRALAAAEAKLRAGAPDAALALLAAAEAGPLDELHGALAERLGAQIAFNRRRGADAPAPLLSAARRLEPLDVLAAREAYLEAIEAATYAGRFGGRTLADAAEAALAAPPAPEPPRYVDLCLDAYAVLYTEGRATAAPLLKRALEAARTEPAVDRLGLGFRTAAELWEGNIWREFGGRQLRLAREAGELTSLLQALNFLSMGQIMHGGDFASVAAMIDETHWIVPSTGIAEMAYAPVGLAAWRGLEVETNALMDSARQEATARGEGRMVTFCDYAAAVLHNGLGNHEDALEFARRAVATDEVLLSGQALGELVEAAARLGQHELAASAVEQLSVRARIYDTEWVRGAEARARALIAEGDTAERLYLESIERLARDGAVGHCARAQLVYGEWLQATGRRADARESLRAAHELFVTKGLRAFAARAANQLQATGEAARYRVVEAPTALTAQEARIARLARRGDSNADIGAQLFISPRTVEYHLRKVFTKLDIKSRRQLEHALSD